MYGLYFWQVRFAQQVEVGVHVWYCPAQAAVVVAVALLERAFPTAASDWPADTGGRPAVPSAAGFWPAGAAGWHLPGTHAEALVQVRFAQQGNDPAPPPGNPETP